MTTTTPVQNDVAELLHEHTELDGRIAALREWRDQLCQIGQPRFGELGMRLHDIRNRLSNHFSAEEEGGYLAVPIKAAPCLSLRAEALRAQHQQFLDDMTARLTATPAEYASWDQACHEFEDFLCRLQAHERAENEIVRTALGDDVASDD